MTKTQKKFYDAIYAMNDFPIFGLKQVSFMN